MLPGPVSLTVLLVELAIACVSQRQFVFGLDLSQHFDAFLEVELCLGWIVFNAILTMRNSQEYGAIGKGVSTLLAGICVVDALAVSFYAPSLIAPCCLAQLFAQILQKKFAAT